MIYAYISSGSPYCYKRMSYHLGLVFYTCICTLIGTWVETRYLHTVGVNWVSNLHLVFFYWEGEF